MKDKRFIDTLKKLYYHFADHKCSAEEHEGDPRVSAHKAAHYDLSIMDVDIITSILSHCIDESAKKAEENKWCHSKVYFSGFFNAITTAEEKGIKMTDKDIAALFLVFSASLGARMLMSRRKHPLEGLLDTLKGIAGRSENKGEGTPIFGGQGGDA